MLGLLCQLGREATCPCRSGSQGSKYSRLEAEVAAMQRNSATYCEEPAPGPAHDAWLASFDLGSHADEIAAITQDNAFMSELQVRLPNQPIVYLDLACNALRSCPPGLSFIRDLLSAEQANRDLDTHKREFVSRDQANAKVFDARRVLGWMTALAKYQTRTRTFTFIISHFLPFVSGDSRVQKESHC